MYTIDLTMSAPFTPFVMLLIAQIHPSLDWRDLGTSLDMPRARDADHTSVAAQARRLGCSRSPACYSARSRSARGCRPGRA